MTAKFEVTLSDRDVSILFDMLDCNIAELRRCIDNWKTPTDWHRDRLFDVEAIKRKIREGHKRIPA